MPKKYGRIAALGGGLLALAFVAGQQAHASVIWDGDTPQGRKAAFGINNCDSPGNVTAVKDEGPPRGEDPSRGEVWQFAKPKGLNRCEVHGISVDGKKYEFQNGSTYYLGWSSKLSSTVNNNATFQWKSYGNHIQNWPIVLKMIDGKLTMIQRQPDKKVYTTWSTPVTANTWNDIVLGIHVSDELTGGWVELYFNGEKQIFSNGADRWPCRTWDSSNEPKWGVYGASNESVINYVDNLKVGTSYTDVTDSLPPAPATVPDPPAPATVADLLWQLLDQALTVGLGGR